jgi:hypothetical protein
MRTIAHIINPVAAGPESDLREAQPLVFESMRIAQMYVRDRVDVDLYSTQYPEDHVVIPDFLKKTPDLERSVLDVGLFRAPRKLPLMKDILDRLYEASDAEYFIYTNVDIILLPHFYSAVYALIQRGYDAFTINKRCVFANVNGPEDLPVLWAEIGVSHPGFDCFVFRRDVYPQYDLGSICIGAPLIGAALAVNLAAHAQRFATFTDMHLTCHLRNDERWWAQGCHAYGFHNFEEYKKIYAHYCAEIQRFPDRVFADRLQKAAKYRPFSDMPLPWHRRCIQQCIAVIPPFIRHRTLPRFLRRMLGKT